MFVYGVTVITPEDSELVKCVKDTKYNPLVAMNQEGLKQTLNLCLNRDPVLPRPVSITYPVNTKQLYNICTMLVQRRRRCFLFTV